jgi:hypothetical protein
MVDGLLVGALRAHLPLNYGHLLPAKPAYQERVHLTQTRSWALPLIVLGAGADRSGRWR